MQIKFIVNIDSEQIRHIDMELFIKDIDMAMRGAIHSYRDGLGHHAQVIDYEIETEEFYGASNDKT